jgi:hypothetical protein
MNELSQWLAKVQMEAGSRRIHLESVGIRWESGRGEWGELSSRRDTPVGRSGRWGAQLLRIDPEFLGQGRMIPRHL